MPTHFTGSLILALYAALDSVAGIMHTLLTVLFAYWRVQDSQLSISETPVEFELEVHSHVVKGMTVGIDVFWSMIMLLIVSGIPSCAQQMEATVALLVSQTVSRSRHPKVSVVGYGWIGGVLTDVRHDLQQRDV